MGGTPLTLSLEKEACSLYIYINLTTRQTPSYTAVLCKNISVFFQEIKVFEYLTLIGIALIDFMSLKYFKETRRSDRKKISLEHAGHLGRLQKDREGGVRGRED